MAPNNTTTPVYVTVPARDGFKGIFAAGRFWENGQSGPHEVTPDELAVLQANKRIAVSTSAPTAPGPALTADEAAFLESYREARQRGVKVELAGSDELSEVLARVTKAEAEAEKLKGRLAELETVHHSETEKLRAQVAQLEAQAKQPQTSEKPSKK